MHLMTERQLYAITHPCARAEAPDDNYSRSERFGPLTIVTLLTVDVYEGAPVWHASISARTDLEVLPWSRYRSKARSFARRYVHDLLRGVGEGDTWQERTDFVLHARRAVDQHELELLREVA